MYAWQTPTSEKFPNSTGRGTMPSSSCSMPDAKPTSRWRPLNAMHRKVRTVVSPPTLSNATSTPRPSVSASATSTKSSRRWSTTHAAPSSAAERGLALAARNRDHPRAGVHAELDRSRTRAASARVHEHRLARAESRTFVHREPREVERHVDGGRVGERQHVGHLERHRGGRDHDLGVAAVRARRDRDDAPADPRVGPVARRFDAAEHFHAGDVRRRHAHRGVAAADPVEVVEVQRRRLDPDAHLARAGHGLVDVVEAQRGGGLAVFMDAPRSHGSAFAGRLSTAGRRRPSPVPSRGGWAGSRCSRSAASRGCPRTRRCPGCQRNRHCTSGIVGRDARAGRSSGCASASSMPLMPHVNARFT